ncbi:Sensor histidine kinase RcsC [Cupriavidus yeoncheonensis]|uniref:Virulence sensor protein BvgS n=1 Tax=Cupriavidus yeoncheonensis TaxID=1462994 RepID=A0A916IWE1_9BURK|nr:ATP-binding protein [Cupriavidus yeoncheonensis]CAG2152338.1 Sensor histidine kinase RcsC [Cupriavidus yeoncheonensis]
MQQLLDSTRVSLASAFDTLADNARRQQHLYSATIAVLIALVVFTAIVLAALETDKHLSQQQSQVARYAATISERLESEAAFVKRSVLSVRHFREAGPTQVPDPATVASVRATGVARIAGQLVGHDYYLMATAATRHAWGPSLPAQLARLQQIALGTLATQQAFGLDHWVYVLSLENDSAAILARQRPDAQATVPIRPELIDILRDTITQAMLDRTGHAVPPGNEQVWAGPIRDPLTGTMVMLSVGAAYSGDTPTVLLAACVPVGDFLAHLERPADTAPLALLNPADEAIDVAAPALPVEASVVSVVMSQARRQPRNLSHYTRHGVLMVQPLKPGFGTLVCFLPYGLLVPALAPELAVILGVGLLLIGAIVLSARYWDRQLLRRTHAEAERALENEILNQILVSATPVGLCIVRQRDYLVLTSNQLAQSLLRLDQGATLPASVTEGFERQPPAAEAGQPAPIARFIVATPGGGDDAGQRYLQITYAPARYGDDKVLFCAVQDVTTQQALEQQLRSAQQATEAMMRARSSFFASMSHEIRTPLNALIGNLELLARSPGLEGHAPRLQALGTAADGLLRIVNDILDFSKIDAGKLQLFNKPFRLAHALEGLALTYAPMAMERGIRLSLQLKPELDREVCGDRIRLTQVVNNLLSNAFKFTTSGRITLSASYGPDEQGRPALTCRVSDSGIGMPPALSERVFQPFVQGDAVATSRHGGTGLGLSICARLCELMGGSISVKSVQDVGSAFTVAVPLPPAGDDAAMATGPDAMPARRGSVMVLCHDARTGECLEAWLATVGWRTHMLASLAAAREHLESHHPQVIVITEEYPPDAFAALHALSSAPVIWLTPDGPHRPRQRAPGIFEVTSFSHDALLACVASAAASPRDDPALSPTAGDADRPVAPAWLPLPDTAGPAILVAEDNPLNQTLIGEQLRALGCRPIITDNGKQALAVAESTHVDAVLTDIHMPLMNGYALLDALRALHPDLPVLAFSALAQQEQADDWQQRGFSGYITKPASLRELGDALQALRGKHACKRQTACADRERYTRLLREQLQADLPRLAQILAARDTRALQAWAHRAASGFGIVRQRTLHAHCREVERLCLGSPHWSPAIAEAGEALQALALRYASEGPAAAAPDSP